MEDQKGNTRRNPAGLEEALAALEKRFARHGDDPRMQEIQACAARYIQARLEREAHPSPAGTTKGGPGGGKI